VGVRPTSLSKMPKEKRHEEGFAVSRVLGGGAGHVGQKYLNPLMSLGGSGDDPSVRKKTQKGG